MLRKDAVEATVLVATPSNSIFYLCTLNFLTAILPNHHFPPILQLLGFCPAGTNTPYATCLS